MAPAPVGFLAVPQPQEVTVQRNCATGDYQMTTTSFTSIGSSMSGEARRDGPVSRVPSPT